MSRAANRLAARLALCFTTAGLVPAVQAAASASPSPGLARSLDALNALCRKATDSGDLEEALRVCRRVSFDIAQLGPGSPAHVESLIGIGNVKALASNFVDADAWYTQALAVSERRTGHDVPASLPLLQLIVEARISRGKFVDAEAVQRRAIAIRVPGATANDASTLQRQLRLADLQSASHQFPEAESRYRDVMERVAGGGAGLREIGFTALQHYAETLEREQKFERAEAAYRQLLASIAEPPVIAQPPVRSAARLQARIGYVVEQQGHATQDAGPAVAGP